MAKGTEAKNLVAKKIAEVFGADYIGEYDKKYYVQAKENGEMVQVAITLTCPKNPVKVSGYVNTSTEMNFEDNNSPKMIATVVNSKEKLEISEEEKKNIEDMMARLGL
jgi:hypothetical protein